MGVQEDAHGKQGVYLKKDVVKVAEDALAKHIRIVAPKILPYAQLVSILHICSDPGLIKGNTSKGLSSQ